jgi:FkbM family methyltransferase
MIHSLIRELGLLIPPIRRLAESRRALLDELAEAEARTRAQATHYQLVVKGTYHAMLSAMAEEVLISVTFNGVPLRLPAGTLVTMSHCIHANESAELIVNVETAHLAWMMDHLGPGGTFLDVGAATGATAIPVANRFGHPVKVIAYEPARRARGLLMRTLDANGITGIDVRAVAVSNAAGIATFREYAPDPTGGVPWRPEASSLLTEKLSGLATDQDIVTTVVTLDSDALPDLGAGPIVIKIDVEGFELLVLRGATRLLRERRPFLSIDIHQDPFRMDGTTTGSDVESFLEGFGYRFTTLGHVLLCEPS